MVASRFGCAPSRPRIDVSPSTMFGRRTLTSPVPVLTPSFPLSTTASDAAASPAYQSTESFERITFRLSIASPR